MDLFVVVVKRNCNRFFIFLRDTTAEAHLIGWTETAISIFFLPLRLTFNGQTGEGNRFQTCGRYFKLRNFTNAVSPGFHPAQRLLDFV